MRWFLDDLWADLAGTNVSPELKFLPPFEQLRKSEWCDEFEQYIRNHMIVGALRYGLMSEQDYGKNDLIREALKRINKYKTTGNLEHLVDAANMLLLQFVHGRRLGQKIISIDDDEHTKENRK